MIIVIANDEKNISVAGFLGSNNSQKAAKIRELLSQKDYAAVYWLATQDREIESSFVNFSCETKNFGDVIFDRFITLCLEIGIESYELAPLMLNAISATGVLPVWKVCAAAYLKTVCKNEYDKLITFAVQTPNIELWRILVANCPERTTDIMLEQLLERPGKDKSVLRLALAETKLKIFPILDEEYSNANLNVRLGIVRLLLMFKNNAEAVRLLDKISESERSMTIQKVLSGDSGAPCFKEICSEHDGKFTVVFGEDNCVFSLEVDDLEIISQSTGGLALAKRAVKSRYDYLQTSFLTGDYLEINMLSEAVAKDPLFARLCEGFLFAIYNSLGYPSVLFVCEDAKLRGLYADIDPDGNSLIAVVHPAELFDTGLQYPAEEFERQLKRDCFLPSKEEQYLSFVPAFSGAFINMQAALKRAAACGLKLGISGDHNYFYIHRGGYYCVNTFSVQKNTVALGKAAFYNFNKLPATGRKIILENAQPLVLRDVPARIFSEFLSAIYFLIRGKVGNTD